MTTALSACRVELSKQIGDFFAGTVTTGGDKTSLIDSSLIPYADDWINDWTWDFMTGTTNSGEERRIDSFDASAGDCTLVSAHTASVALTSTYEIHRLFPATQKRKALIYAARAGFPNIHEKIWDESMVSGNWLKDGSFEIWVSSALSHWTVTTVTAAEANTAGLFKHGSKSCKLSGTTGTIKQSISNWDDLKRLAGKSVVFTVQGHSSAASSLYLTIYDGTTTTNSSYHLGTSDWTSDDKPLEVSATIADTPTEITFTINYASGTAYIDDARVISSSSQPRLYIADLGLAQEYPTEVFVETSNYSDKEPWKLVHNAVIDTENGYLYLPPTVTNDRRLRIKGMGYLDFLASGVSSTAWTATINIEKPQTDILVAQAALYLYTEMAMPNFSQGDRKDYMEMMGFWEQELRKRIGKHGMPIPSSVVKWR